MKLTDMTASEIGQLSVAIADILARCSDCDGEIELILRLLNLIRENLALQYLKKCK